MNKRVAILISGGGSNMLALVQSMQGPLPGRCVLVASNDPAAGGLTKAQALGIPTAAVNHRDYADRAAFEAALLEPILAAEPDVICLAGFMRVLTEKFIAQYPRRIINIHPSLLPAFPGLHTHRQALAAGVKIHGTTVHFVTPQLDHGPIIVQAAIPVLPSDDESTLAQRVLEQEHRIYPQALRWLAEDRVVFTANDVVEIRGLSVSAKVEDQYFLVPKE